MFQAGTLLTRQHPQTQIIIVYMLYILLVCTCAYYQMNFPVHSYMFFLVFLRPMSDFKFTMSLVNTRCCLLPYSTYRDCGLSLYAWFPCLFSELEVQTMSSRVMRNSPPPLVCLDPSDVRARTPMQRESTVTSEPSNRLLSLLGGFRLISKQYALLSQKLCIPVSFLSFICL